MLHRYTHRPSTASVYLKIFCCCVCVRHNAQIKVEKNNAIVNALNRTKREESPDLAALQEERAAEIRREQKKIRKQQDQVSLLA